MKIRSNLVWLVVGVGFATFSVGAACEDESSRPPESLPNARTPAKVMDPSCGDVGTYVVFSLTAFQDASSLGDTATFAGGGAVKGKATYDEQDDRWTLGVNVPPGTVTGPVTISKNDSGGSYDFGVFTVGCAASTDAGTDAAPVVEAPPAGFLTVRTSNLGVNAEGKFGLSATDSNAETAANDYALAALALSVGRCSQGWDPPDGPATKPDGGDLGSSVELKDGTTTIAKLDRKTDGLYIGNGSTPVFGKKLDLALPGGGATTVLPATVAGLVQTISAELVVTEPASSGATMTQGQPFKFAWNAFDADTFVVTFPGNPTVCRLDPKAGEFSVPATTTAQLAAGQFQTAILQAITRRVVNVKVGDADRSLRGYSGMIRAVSYTVQP